MATTDLPLAAELSPSFRGIDLVATRITSKPDLLQFYINKPPSCTNVILKRYRDPPASAVNAPKILSIHFMRGDDIIAKSYVPCPKPASLFKAKAELKILKPTEKAPAGGCVVFFRKK